MALPLGRARSGDAAVTANDAAPDRQQLAGLVFELASQLHVERAQRVALQVALERAGVVDAATLLALACDPELRRRDREMLEQSIAKLFRVLTEEADPNQPRGAKS
jgi:hypothetical protein